jgi:RHS repeat-associated protein
LTNPLSVLRLCAYNKGQPTCQRRLPLKPSYYLGGKLVAQREGTTLRYVHQDGLSGTSVMSDTSGASLGTIAYFPFGSTRSGSVPTDKKPVLSVVEGSTGQRLDGTGLYYYNARYYPVIGRFISADTVVPEVGNPASQDRHRAIITAYWARHNNSKCDLISGGQ